MLSYKSTRVGGSRLYVSKEHSYDFGKLDRKGRSIGCYSVVEVFRNFQGNDRRVTYYVQPTRDGVAHGMNLPVVTQEDADFKKADLAAEVAVWNFYQEKV